LTTGDLSETSIFLGTDNHNVRTTTDGKIQITTPGEGNNVWEFGTDGELTLPNGGHIGPSGGKGAGTTYGAANDHLVSLTSYYNSGLYSSCVTAYADGTLNITAYNDGGPNPAKIWTFDNTGTLTLPDDSGIKSSTNIDITIDTPDSSTFNWRFGADGELTLPNGMTIDSDGTMGANATVTIGGTNTEIRIDNNGAPPGFLITTDKTGENYQWTFGEDGITSLPGDLELNSTGNIRSENAINIEVNLSDSTLRRWQFGEDGDLTVPGDIVNGAGESFLKDIPQNSPTGYTVNPYVLQASDRGRHILIDGSEGNSIEIPTDATEPMPVGSAIVLVIKPGEYTVFVSAEDLGAMVIHGAGVGSNMIYELDPGTGGAMATLVKIGANEWMISGTGLAEYTGP
jgi:hypothetical protein